MCFLKPFVLWWKLLACCCSLTADRLLSLQMPFHPQRRFQSGEWCCALWQAVMSTGSLREGLGGMRFRSTCFGRFFSGHGCGFHRPAVENGSVWWLSLHMLPLDLSCSFYQNMDSCHSENAVTSAGTIRVKSLDPNTCVVGLQNNLKNSFPISLTLSNPTHVPPPHWPWLRQEIVLHPTEWYALGHRIVI